METQIPPCAAQMGCLCAGHARGDAANAPCNTDERADTSHLSALLLGLSNERQRLSRAKTAQERALRTVWVAQREKEVRDEQRRLGIDPAQDQPISIEDIRAALSEES